MAKRPAPQKKCVKKGCGEMMHARKNVCPKCQTLQPVKEKPVSEPKPEPENELIKQQTPEFVIIEAIRFVRVCGGIGRAITLLEELYKLPRA
jgi:hypothetical protein